MAPAKAATYAVMTLAALMLLLVLAAFNLDFGRFSAPAASLLSELLQRELVFEGPLSITLDVDGDLGLSATNVRLAGTEWSSEPDLARVGELRLSLNLWSALGEGPVILDSLSVSDVQLHLEQDTEGNNNWTLWAEDTVEADKERFQLPLLPESARLRDILITLATPVLQQTLRIEISELTETVSPGRAVVVQLRGSINDEPLQLQLSSPQIDNFVDLREVKLALAGGLNQISFEGDFAIDDLLQPVRPTARFHLTGPNAEYLLEILKIDRATSGPLNLTLTSAPDNGNMDLKVEGSFGGFKVAADGSFSDLRSMNSVDLKYLVEGPDLGRLAALLGVEDVPEEPFSFGGTVLRSGPEVTLEQLNLQVGEASLLVDGHIDDYTDLAGAEASAQINLPVIEKFASLLGLPPSIKGQANGNFAITPRSGGDGDGDGDGALYSARGTLNDMAFKTTGVLSNSADFAGSVFQLDLSGPTAVSLATILGMRYWPEAAFSAQLNLTRTEWGMVINESQVLIGPDRLTLEGSVHDDFLDEKTELNFDLAGPSLAPLLGALGQGFEHLSPQPYRIQGQLTGADGYVSINNLVATAGGERIAVNGIIAGSPMDPETRLVFDLSSPSLKGALARNGFAIDDLPEGPMSASGVVLGGGDLFSLDDTVLEFAGAKAKFSGKLLPDKMLNGSQILLAVDGPNLDRVLPFGEPRKGLARPFNLTANLRMADGVLMIENAVFGIDKTRVRLNSTIGMTPASAGGTFDASANSVDLLPLTQNFSKDVGTDRLPMNLQSRGHWSEKSVTLEEIDLRLGQARVVVSGTLKEPPDFDETNLSLEGQLPDLSELSRLLGWELPALPARLRFRVTGRGNEIRVNDFSSTVGGSDIEGNFKFSYAEVPDFSGELRSRRLDVTPFLPDGVHDGPSPPTNRVRDSNKRLIPELRLPMDTLQRFVATFTFTADELLVNAKTYRDMSLEGLVADGALTVNRLSMTSGQGGNLAATGRLLPTARGGLLTMRMTGDSLNLGLVATTPEEFQRLPRYDLNLALISEGATLRELAAGANGYMKLRAGKGRVRAGALRMLTNDFVNQVMQSLNPFAAQDPYTKVICATILATVEGGKLSGHPVFVMRSKRVNIFADADVDLGTEKITVTFNTVPQKGLGFGLSNLINPYIMVSGTLANPVLSLDPESALIQGGAAVATGGISILAKGFIDRYLSSKDPCGDAYKNADESMQALEEQYGGAIDAGR